jgi:hypothetical protein
MYATRWVYVLVRILYSQRIKVKLWTDISYLSINTHFHIYPRLVRNTNRVTQKSILILQP